MGVPDRSRRYARPTMRLRTFAPLTALIALVAPAVAAAVPPPVTTVAYVKYTSGAQPPQVWATTDGHAPVKLAANGYQPIVSPSGSLVAYSVPTKTATKLVVATAAGTGKRTLTTAASVGTPVWSPDASKLTAVIGSELGRESLVVLDVATGAKRTIATGFFNGASFSPDGSRLAYGRASRADDQGFAGDVYVVPLTGIVPGTPANVTADGASVAPLWGPESIVFSHLRTTKGRRADYPKANLRSIRPDGTGLRILTKLKIPYLLSGLYATAFSLDGKHLLAEYGGQDHSEAWTYDFTTGKARDLTGKTDEVTGFGISRDGATVLAGTGGYDPQAKADVVTYSFAGKHRKTLIKNAAWASWSPGI